ncbi:MAG: type II toxin-antitoxin system Phd/YefM family antitoxin [Candidatus Acidiferrales bacterium]
MEEIAISKFKAQCLGILERVRRTRCAIRITKFGKPVAEVVPPSEPVVKQRVLGGMRGHIKILGDIVAPASDERDWDVLKS